MPYWKVSVQGILPVAIFIGNSINQDSYFFKREFTLVVVGESETIGCDSSGSLDDDTGLICCSLKWWVCIYSVTIVFLELFRGELAYEGRSSAMMAILVLFCWLTYVLFLTKDFTLPIALLIVTVVDVGGSERRF